MDNRLDANVRVAPIAALVGRNNRRVAPLPRFFHGQLGEVPRMRNADSLRCTLGEGKRENPPVKKSIALIMNQVAATIRIASSVP